MNPFRIKYSSALFAAAFILALVIRLVGADQLPLNNTEADLALQAMALTRGQSALISPQPAYLLLTTLLMYVFNATNWVARFWPALAGSLLALLPALFQKRIGRIPAIIMAFGLALDPGLLAVSRQAGSLPLALFFTLLAAGLWLERRLTLAAVAFAGALLSGPAFWPGLIGLLVARWVVPDAWQVPAVPEREPAPATEAVEDEPVTGGADAQMAVPETTPAASPAHTLHPALIALLATLFVAGTLFFFIPTGLSAFAGGLPAYLSGWTSLNGVSTGMVLLGLILYEFFPLLFGIWGGITGILRGDAFDRFLLIWFVVALILELAYPSHQVADLGWTIIPLWALAARQIVSMVRVPSGEREDILPMLGQGVLAVVILTFISMAVLAIVNNAQFASDPVQLQQYLFRIAGALVMLFASSALIWWGWSRMVALRGLGWSFLVIAAVFSLSAGWDTSGLSSHQGREFWNGSAPVESADLVVGSVNQLRQIGPAVAGGPDLLVAGVPSPSLRWTLRNTENVSFSDQLPTSGSPAMVITPDQPKLALSANYRGQGLTWTEKQNWQMLSAPDWFRWVAFRVVPDVAQTPERIILWARVDLFPGGEQAGQPATP